MFKTIIIGLLCLGFLAAVGVSLFGNPLNLLPQSQPDFALANGELRIPMSQVDNGQAHFFDLPHEGKTISFFVLKSQDGVMRAALDACDVCFKAKKGYRQEDQFMICNNCGMAFHSTRINEEKGGCNPAPLDRSIDGTDLVIPLAQITAGARFF